MFDIGFWELIVISGIGLLILGPERLPGAIRSVLKTVNAVKKSVSQVGTELKQELEIDELHANLKKAEEQGLESLNGANSGLKESLDELRARADEVTRPYAPRAEQADDSENPSTTKQPADSAKADKPEAETFPNSEHKPHE